MSSSELLLEPGTRLLHIGPHKTGTSALQKAFHQARPALSEHGVHYAGRGEQPFFAAIAATGGRGRLGDRHPEPAEWNELVDEVHNARAERIVISSEMFDDADATAARRIVDDLGGPNVHVVVTLRPLTKILPSAWQQYVRNQLRDSYDEWLQGMLIRPPYSHPTPSFWRRHDHGVLVSRWAKIVGPERLTVVMVDETNPGQLTSVFEELSGLPRGTLRPGSGSTNRSLTFGETELLRQINVEFHNQGWPDSLYGAVRDRLVQAWQLRVPDSDELRMPTPPWAMTQAADRGAKAALTIQATGVRVIGDLNGLAARPSNDTGGRPADAVGSSTERVVDVPVAVALQTAIELLEVAHLVEDGDVENRLVKRTTAKQLLQVVAERGRRRLRHKLAKR